MTKVLLGLGSNLGDRTRNIKTAIKLIESCCGRILRISSFYETQPWGKTDQPFFINLVVSIQTSLGPIEILDNIKKIEKVIGRKRFEKWGERTIDIDILFFDKEIIETETLIIPHPFLHERNFALIPMKEIEPDFEHPVLKLTISELLKHSKDELSVNKIQQIVKNV